MAYGVYAGKSVEGGLKKNYIQNLGFAVGTRVKVWTKVDKTNVEYVGIVVGNYDDFFNVEVQTKNNGSFIISVNKVELATSFGSTKCKEVA